MKKAIKLLTGLTLSFVFMATSVYAAPQITTTGTGIVDFSPNIARLHLGVTTQVNDARDAFTYNTARIESLTNALVNVGISQNDIETGNFFMWPNRHWTEEGERDIVIVENSLTITVRNLDILNDVINTAVANDANNISHIAFDSTNIEAYYLRALSLAIENGKSRAAAIASAASVSLAPLTAVNEGWQHVGAWHSASFGTRDESSVLAAAGNVITAPNSLSVSANVTLVFGN